MVRKIKLVTAEDLKELMNLAWKCPNDVGVHTVQDEIADAKSILGLMSLDYTKPVRVVSEDEGFLKKVQKWAVE